MYSIVRPEYRYLYITSHEEYIMEQSNVCKPLFESACLRKKEVEVLLIR